MVLGMNVLSIHHKTAAAIAAALISFAAPQPGYAGPLEDAQASWSDALSAPASVSLPVQRPRVAQARPVAEADYAQQSTVSAHPLPGCTARQQRGFQLVLGALSHCMGGRLSGSEREVMVFDKTARQRSEAARLALREDPRQLMRLPLTASAGLSVPITQHAQIGVEYSFSEAGRTSPFQFRPGGRPADELAGHSATFRVGLNL